MATKNFKEVIADVEAFVFDVDGVFTDGDIIPLADGEEHAVPLEALYDNPRLQRLVSIMRG